jgi:hypothetical protein
MHVRSAFRYLYPNSQISVSDLWANGHTYMDLAYNAATQRPVGNTFVLDQPDMVFFFVGGRSSLIQFFATPENNRLFLPANGIALGLITERKQYMFKKDKTLVGICNLSLKTSAEITPITDFIGQTGVQPLDAKGANLTSAQLATILRNLFRDKGRRGQDVQKVLSNAFPW